MPTADETETTLTAWIETLRGGAERVERTFNTGCERLGEGLVLFATLKDNFAELGNELASADMDATRSTLRRLAEELQAVAHSLGGEAQLLSDMTQRDVAAAEALGELRQHLQIIDVLARSTRIEAASFASNRLDISSFTDRIIGLTGQTKAAVDVCLRDRGRLSALLAGASDQQRAFMQGYQEALSSVASKLQQSERALVQRAAKSLALTASSAARAETLSGAVGNAVVSMQSGDSIRQRLEHAVEALVSLETADGPPGAGDYARVVRQLQSAQLSEAAVTLQLELQRVDAALAALEYDGSSMVTEAKSHFGGDADSAKSFLDGLEAELAEASALIEKCEAARAGVNEATRALSGMLEQFQQTVSGLTQSIQDIAMIGTNAGLLAKRLGLSGRGLVVIAGEVKKTAAQVEQDAIRLHPLFKFLQDAASALRERLAGGVRELSALDAAMRHSLETMRGSGTRLRTAFERLASAGGGFTGIVGESRTEFADLGEVAALLPSAAEALAAQSAAGPVPPGLAPALEDQLRREVFPRYTMAEERDIHHRVLEAFDLRHETEADAREVA